MSTNPSHILIARNSRGAQGSLAGHSPNHAPSPAAPTETHAAASGIFRSRNRGTASMHGHRRSTSHGGERGGDVAGLTIPGFGSGSSGSGSSSAGGNSGNQGWFLEELDSDDSASAFGSGDELGSNGADSVELDQTFTRQCRFPGTVKIVVESTTFWVHREVLVFASPFFEAALSGDWSETRKGDVDGDQAQHEEQQQDDADADDLDLDTRNTRRKSISSVITINQANPHEAPSVERHTPSPICFASGSTLSVVSTELIDSAASTPTLSSPPSGLGCIVDIGPKDKPGATGSGGEESESDLDDLKTELEALELTKQSDSPAKGAGKSKKRSGKERQSSASTMRDNDVQVDAIIVLKEEKAYIFHDFLKFVYPHLECQITWNNVEGLLNLGSKLCVPALAQQCLSFLLTHAAGKPIKAMRIAEIYEDDLLYRESSRFVLDNPGGWSESELSTLSQETLLKLEKRRNWFLERVLKLGLANIQKDYQCCPSCPDPPTCARLLEEKWRHAYNACFRFGPCQPSMVYRYLRGLEGVTPPLALTQLACQAAAKAFVIALFDRMFSLGVAIRGIGTGAPNGAETAQTAGVQRTVSQGAPRSNAAVALGLGGAAVVPHTAPTPKRHFLYCTLRG